MREAIQGDVQLGTGVVEAAAGGSGGVLGKVAAGVDTNRGRAVQVLHLRQHTAGDGEAVAAAAHLDLAGEGEADGLVGVIQQTSLIV